MRKQSAVIVLIIMTLLAVDAYGQDRAFLRKKIQEWGECKNVAMTLTGGDLALYGDNGWAGTGLPSNLQNELNKLNDNDELIDDVQLTESGKWLILYGDNGIIWNDIPRSLELKLKELNGQGEVITSVTFNDNGDWIVVTTEFIVASTSEIYDFIEDGLQEYGQLWAAHLTDEGLVLCYSEGYKFLGEVPATLRKKLSETDIDVYRVKFLSDGAFFIADQNGKYDYYF